MESLEINVMKYGEVDAITLNGALTLGTAVNNLRQKMDNLAAHGANQFVLTSPV